MKKNYDNYLAAFEKNKEMSYFILNDNYIHKLLYSSKSKLKKLTKEEDIIMYIGVDFETSEMYLMYYFRNETNGMITSIFELKEDFIKIGNDYKNNKEIVEIAEYLKENVFKFIPSFENSISKKKYDWIDCDDHNIKK